MDYNNFIFVGDLIETEEELPLHLFGDFYFNKASGTQIKKIKKVIENYTGLTKGMWNKYETLYKPTDKNGCTMSHLNEDKWKYFVIEHSHEMADLKIWKIFSLSSLDLTILFETYDNGLVNGGAFKIELSVINYFHDSVYERDFIPKTKSFSLQGIEELKYLDVLISTFNKFRYPFIDKALSDFLRIKDISKLSPFKVLSCFSILELLLTSQKSKVSNDSSLTNQLKKKINLLNNQLSDKVQIKKYFKCSDSVTLEIIVEKLYQYRSDIAHGNISNFEKELDIFKNQTDNILPFLTDLIRRILVISLEQPQLLTDLREC